MNTTTTTTTTSNAQPSENIGRTTIQLDKTYKQAYVHAPRFAFPASHITDLLSQAVRNQLLTAALSTIVREIKADFPHPFVLREQDTYRHFGDFFASFVRQLPRGMSRAAETAAVLEFIAGETPYYWKNTMDFIATTTAKSDVKLGVYGIVNFQEMRDTFEKDEKGVFIDAQWEGVWTLAYGRYRKGGARNVGSGKDGKISGAVSNKPVEGQKVAVTAKGTKKDVIGGNKFAVLADMAEEGDGELDDEE